MYFCLCSLLGHTVVPPLLGMHVHTPSLFHSRGARAASRCAIWAISSTGSGLSLWRRGGISPAKMEGATYFPAITAVIYSSRLHRFKRLDGKKYKNLFREITTTTTITYHKNMLNKMCKSVPNDRHRLTLPPSCLLLLGMRAQKSVFLSLPFSSGDSGRSLFLVDTG